MKKIDFEAHHYIKELLEMISDRYEIPIFNTGKKWMYHGGNGIISITPILDRLLDFTEGRIELMDKSRVDCGILSCSLGVEQLEPELGIKAAVVPNNPDQFNSIQRGG